MGHQLGSWPCQVELEQVLGLGMAPSCIIYAYPCKAVPHIECATCHGVKLLVFDIEKKLNEVAQDHPGPGVTGRGVQAAGVTVRGLGTKAT